MRMRWSSAALSSKVLGPLLVCFIFDFCGCFQLFGAYFIPIDPCEIKHHIADVRMPDVLPTLSAPTPCRKAVLFFSFSDHKHEMIMVILMLHDAGRRARVLLSNLVTCSAARSCFCPLMKFKLRGVKSLFVVLPVPLSC